MSFASSPHSLRNKIARSVWGVAYIALFRISPNRAFGYRRVLLKIFGAKIAAHAIVYPTVKIWAPWNLEMAEHSCLSHHVDCYNQAPIALGSHAVISQRSFLCTATHDYSFLTLPLIVKSIRIERYAWICADAYVGPGVTIAEGSVVATRAVVTRDTSPFAIFGGIPARKIADRKIKS